MTTLPPIVWEFWQLKNTWSRKGLSRPLLGELYLYIVYIYYAYVLYMWIGRLCVYSSYSVIVICTREGHYLSDNSPDFTTDRFAWRQAAQLLPLLQFAWVRVTYFSLIYCVYRIWRRRWKCVHRLAVTSDEQVVACTWNFRWIPHNWESHTFRPSERTPQSHAYYSVTTTLCK
jgi:hypothetical protein